MRRILAAVVCVAAGAVAAGQGESSLPKGDRTPTPLFDPGGPAAPVTALAFTPDGQTLFAAGLDKTIRVYRAKAGRWAADVPLRVPAGRANAGAVNALAVSDDGRWLAAAGRSPMRGEAWGAAGGVVVGTDQLPGPMRRDLGVIYLFDLTNPAGGRVLRAHPAAVRGLAFAAGTPTPVLLSAAVEPGADGAETGTVRAWDVAAGAELAARTGFPANPTGVGLGGWPSGAGKKNLTVAVAWPEVGPMAAGSLRVWDVARDSVTPLPDGAENRALAVLRSAAGTATAVVSGGFADPGVRGRQQGVVHVRPIDGTPGRTAAFPYALRGQHQLPRAAAPIGGDVVLLVERSPRPAGETHRLTDLVLLDPQGGERVRVELRGGDPDYLPTLAASPKGDTLAVAGFTDRRIEVYALADLKPGAVPQVLRGGPPGFTGVRFVNAGTAVDLAAADGTSTVFDFANRTVGPAGGARQLDAPPADGVRFQVVPPDAGNGRYEVRVTAGGNAVSCRLDPGAVPTDGAVAYLPGKPAWMPALGPLVAVGHTDPANAHTLITLFDGATGRPVRQLSGHLLPVRGLAFSAARPLLASVADDGTACVWSLKDIDRPVGTIDGLAVADRNGAVTVESAGEGVKDLLAAGDVIEAVGGGEKPAAVTSVVDFAWKAAAATPGKTLAVRVRGKAAAVVLPVSRGADERKPLFTLWVGPGGRDWAAWSPAGPYDVSGPAAETRLGWLTNTGDPKAPTTFAGADQYREQFYQRGLLKFLAEKADLAAALDARAAAFAPPPPRLALSIPEAAGRWVRFGKATLRVELENLAPGFPLAAAELRYRVWDPGRKDQPAWEVRPTTAPRPWTFDLPEVVRRGAATVEVELAPRRGGSRAAHGSVSFVAVPPAPTLAVKVNGAAVERTVTVKEPKVSLDVRAAGHGKEPVAVTVTAGADERKLTPAADGTFPAVALPLKPGDNIIRVRAENADASTETRGMESAELAVTVRYDEPMKEPTPTVGPVEFTPAGERVKRDGKDVIAVAVPAAEAAARVTAEHPLKRVEVAAGGRSVALDAAGKKEFDVRHKLTLEPDKPVRVVVTAATANSDAGEQAAEVVYWPFPPEVAVSPLAADTVTAPALALSGTFAQTAGAVPFTIQVVASAPGREPKAFDAKIDPAARTWAADVALFTGPNTLTVVSRNAWRERRLTDAVTVAYRRPPKVFEAKEADAGATAVADVTLTVDSPDGLPPTAVLVAGRPVPIDAPKKLVMNRGVVRWVVVAPGVPVKTADGWLESLSVVVRNADGDSAPATVAVKRSAPPPVAPPRVVLRDRPATSDAARLPVRFVVTSAGPLRRVELQRRAGDAGEYERVAAFDPRGAVRAGDGFAFEGEAEVELRDEANRVRVLAVNDGGEGEDGFTVGRPQPPVKVVIDGLDEVNLDGTPVGPLPPVAAGFGPAKGPFAVVRGRVRWANPDDPGLADPAVTVAVSVNRVNFFPVALGPAENGARRFEARLFLNGKDNVVRVAVRAGGPDRAVPLQKAGGEFTVGCGAPLGRQRLHVVVVGVDVPAGGQGELARQVVRALGGDAPERFEVGQFKAPGFDRAVLYQPVVGEVQRGHVRGVLAKVADTIRGLTADAKENWVNDVVLIYYRGRDWVDADGRRWLHTSQSLRYQKANWRDHAVRADQLPESAGVKLVLLNVVDEEGRPAASRDFGVPVLRYGWADPAARPRLLTLLGQALEAKATLGDVADYLKAKLLSAEAGAGPPVEHLHDDVRDRRVGRGKP